MLIKELAEVDAYWHLPSKLTAERCPIIEFDIINFTEANTIACSDRLCDIISKIKLDRLKLIRSNCDGEGSTTLRCGLIPQYISESFTEKVKALQEYIDKNSVGCFLIVQNNNLTPYLKFRSQDYSLYIDGEIESFSSLITTSDLPNSQQLSKLTRKISDICKKHVFSKQLQIEESILECELNQIPRFKSMIKKAWILRAMTNDITSVKIGKEVVDQSLQNLKYNSDNDDMFQIFSHSLLDICLTMIMVSNEKFSKSAESLFTQYMVMLSSDIIDLPKKRTSFLRAQFAVLMCKMFDQSQFTTTFHPGLYLAEYDPSASIIFFSNTKSKRATRFLEDSISIERSIDNAMREDEINATVDFCQYDRTFIGYPVQIPVIVTFQRLPNTGNSKEIYLKVRNSQKVYSVDVSMFTQIIYVEFTSQRSVDQIDVCLMRSLDHGNIEPLVSANFLINSDLPFTIKRCSFDKTIVDITCIHCNSIFIKYDGQVCELSKFETLTISTEQNTIIWGWMADKLEYPVKFDIIKEVLLPNSSLDRETNKKDVMKGNLTIQYKCPSYCVKSDRFAATIQISNSSLNDAITVQLKFSDTNNFKWIGNLSCCLVIEPQSSDEVPVELLPIDSGLIDLPPISVHASITNMCSGEHEEFNFTAYSNSEKKIMSTTNKIVFV
ncbi:hypothetical protein GJ496_006700 [Pomphorhynchus laevis]|nr:hypothetical protein GJ496_006700 [Pomphorhynchus laevis]